MHTFSKSFFGENTYKFLDSRYKSNLTVYLLQLYFIKPKMSSACNIYPYFRDVKIWKKKKCFLRNYEIE